MSSALGIAAVTWVLRDLLNEGLIDSQVSGGIRVTARPPLRELDADPGERSQLNLFLYHLAPNPGWRNSGPPRFDSGGARVAQPPLALDLHYLLTAYDEQPLHAEVLLGYALQLLHETPVLTRDAIRSSLRREVLDGDSLPGLLQQLHRSGLADQVEAIKITPQTLGTDEMSKLWTGFQAPYRPSVAYLVTTVLIESARTRRTALPVLRVGGDARGPAIQGSLLPPIPTLLAVRAPHYQPAARSNDVVHLLGHHLEGANPLVVLRHPRLGLELHVPIGTADVTPPPSRQALRDGPDETFDLPDDVLRLAQTRVRVNLGNAVPAAGSEGMAAGLFTLELRVERPGEGTARTSNALALAIAPSLLTGEVTRESNLTTIRVTCHPPVHRGQTVSLIVGDYELTGEPVFPTDTSGTTGTLVFRGTLPPSLFAHVGSPPEPPQHRARLRVDGVEGLFIRSSRPPGPPQFDFSEGITFP